MKDCPVTVNPVRLVDCRLRLGVSQWLLARVIGVDDATLDQWETARGLVRTTSSLAQIANAVIDAAACARNPEKLGKAMFAAAMEHGPIAALYLCLHAKHWQLVQHKRNQAHKPPTKELPL